MKPIMKWAGGKARLAGQIHLAFHGPCEGVYYEPFVGSASVFLHRRALGDVKRAVLSDANHKLMSVYRALRDDVEGVLSAIDDLPGDDWRERYKEIRAAYNEGPHDGCPHAARFLWLNRACFNGLYRENKSGRYNVPVGSYSKLSLPSREHFKSVAELLQGVELISADFEEVMAGAGTDDQIYCDPPYVPLTKTASFTGYCKEPFGLPQQHSLARCARVAAQRGARVVLSNHDLPLVRQELYPVGKGFQYLGAPKVRRAISRKAESRKKVGEVIAAIGPRTVAA
jgi:DNA adenine methylase